MTVAVPSSTTGSRALLFVFLAAMKVDLQAAAGVAAPKIAPAFTSRRSRWGCSSSPPSPDVRGAGRRLHRRDKMGPPHRLIIALRLRSSPSGHGVHDLGRPAQFVLRFITGVGLGGALPEPGRHLPGSGACRRSGVSRGGADGVGMPLGAAVASLVALLDFHGTTGARSSSSAARCRSWCRPCSSACRPSRSVNHLDEQLVEQRVPVRMRSSTNHPAVGSLGSMVVYLLMNWLPQLLVLQRLLAQRSVARHDPPQPRRRRRQPARRPVCSTAPGASARDQSPRLCLRSALSP